MVHTVAERALAQLAGPVAQVVVPEEGTVRTLVPLQIEQTVELVHDEQLVTVQLVVVVATQAPETRLYPVRHELGVKVEPDIVPLAQLVQLVGTTVQVAAVG